MSLPITVFFCLLMNVLMTYLSGTLWGSDGRAGCTMARTSTISRSTCWCAQAYVTAAVCLVTTTAISWSKFNGYSNDAEGGARPPPPTPTPPGLLPS